jgi:hypothetical protein
MSIKDFTATIQSHAYKAWLDKLEKNIVTNTAESLRESQQVASKTDFYITSKNLRSMYKTVTGIEMDDLDVQVLLQELAKPEADKKGALEGRFTTIAGNKGVKFESVGFKTISARLVKLFDADVKVQDAYEAAESKYRDAQVLELNKDRTLKGRAKQDRLDAIDREAKRRGSFGYFFNKGHVVSIATNLTKNFRAEINKADQLAENQRKILVEVLDSYINKLQKDDLATANLPDAVSQELYAGYIKSSDKYLVEIQLRTENVESGSASIPIIRELRKLFTLNDKDTEAILNNSPALNEALLTSKGSPSFAELLALDLALTMSGKRKSKEVFKAQPALVNKKKTPIVKPKSNKADIQKLKALKTKIKNVKKSPQQFKVSGEETYSLVLLQALINENLQNVVSANMGDGDQRSILNYRTGRFAASPKVLSMLQSRDGMITAFYTYMKNPYATFSEGGRQSRPRSRDPKLLIAKSIREIAETKVANRLRSVLV